MNNNDKFYNLKTPTLEELKKVFDIELKGKFDFIQSQIIDCPDFTKDSFKLVAKGICGKPVIVDVGGFKNLLPKANLDAKFDLAEVHKYYQEKKSFICGAGAGPFHEFGTNSEMVANMAFDDSNHLKNNSYYSKYENMNYKTFQAATSKFGLLGQFICSEGKTGKVLNIKFKKRLVEGSVVSFMQKALAKIYAKETLTVGLGGVIVMKSGQAKIHVMPPFSKEPLDCPEKVDKWLKFLTVSAPLVIMGEMVSHDPLGLDLRMEHFHGFTIRENNKDVEAGHFHYDLTADDVEYDAYFVVSERLMRLHQPK